MSIGTDHEQLLLSDLEQLVRPRNARWDALGLLAVRSSFIRDRIEALGTVEEHAFEDGLDTGVNVRRRS